MNFNCETHFPFSALQGQNDQQTALLISAIDPMIGGVLIEGPRGTAKSTAARGLADLLDGAKLVNLPLTTSEEQLIGSINIEAALQDGEVEFKPGLLQAAHNGVLYVDEVNLLADHLVDALLDVCASGINRIERDGISHQHPARFVLIGTMNPEEGELRPQLLDRFGLYVQLPAGIAPEIRQRIVQARLAFDNNPEKFIADYAEQQTQLKQNLRKAQQRIQTIEYSDAIMLKVAEICYQANVEGVRADLTLLRAARAHAAWQGRTAISEDDIIAVQHWVLAHRANASTNQQVDNSVLDEQQSPTENKNTPTNNDFTNNQIENENPSGSNTSEQDWGALPPQRPEITPVKSLKPLAVKK